MTNTTITIKEQQIEVHVAGLASEANQAIGFQLIFLEVTCHCVSSPKVVIVREKNIKKLGNAKDHYKRGTKYQLSKFPVY